MAKKPLRKKLASHAAANPTQEELVSAAAGVRGKGLAEEERDKKKYDLIREGVSAQEQASRDDYDKLAGEMRVKRSEIYKRSYNPARFGGGLYNPSLEEFDDRLIALVEQLKVAHPGKESGAVQRLAFEQYVKEENEQRESEKKVIAERIAAITDVPPERKALPLEGEDDYVRQNPELVLGHLAYKKTLPVEQSGAMDTYSTGKSYALNERLREYQELEPEQQKLYQNLQAAISGAPQLSKAVTAFRGLNFSAESSKGQKHLAELRALKESGKPFTSPALLSTSINPNRVTQTFSGKIAYQIESNKGLWLGHKEAEVLHEHGAEFDIGDIEENAGMVDSYGKKHQFTLVHLRRMAAGLEKPGEHLSPENTSGGLPEPKKPSLHVPITGLEMPQSALANFLRQRQGQEEPAGPEEPPPLPPAVSSAVPSEPSPSSGGREEDALERSLEAPKEAYADLASATPPPSKPPATRHLVSSGGEEVPPLPEGEGAGEEEGFPLGLTPPSSTPLSQHEVGLPDPPATGSFHRAVPAAREDSQVADAQQLSSPLQGMVSQSLSSEIADREDATAKAPIEGSESEQQSSAENAPVPPDEGLSAPAATVKAHAASAPEMPVRSDFIKHLGGGARELDDESLERSLEASPEQSESLGAAAKSRREESPAAYRARQQQREDELVKEIKEERQRTKEGKPTKWQPMKHGVDLAERRAAVEAWQKSDQQAKEEHEQREREPYKAPHSFGSVSQSEDSPTLFPEDREELEKMKRKWDEKYGPVEKSRSAFAASQDDVVEGASAEGEEAPTTKAASGYTVPTTHKERLQQLAKTVEDLSSQHGIDLTKLAKFGAYRKDKTSEQTGGHSWADYHRPSNKIGIRPSTFASEDMLQKYVLHEAMHALDSKLGREKFGSHIKGSVPQKITQQELATIEASGELTGKSDKYAKYRKKPHELFVGAMLRELQSPTNSEASQVLAAARERFKYAPPEPPETPAITAHIGGEESLPASPEPPIVKKKFLTSVEVDEGTRLFAATAMKAKEAADKRTAHSKSVETPQLISSIAGIAPPKKNYPPSSLIASGSGDDPEDAPDKSRGDRFPAPRWSSLGWKSTFYHGGMSSEPTALPASFGLTEPTIDPPEPFGVHPEGYKPEEPFSTLSSEMREDAALPLEPEDRKTPAAAAFGLSPPESLPLDKEEELESLMAGDEEEEELVPLIAGEEEKKVPEPTKKLITSKKRDYKGKTPAVSKPLRGKFKVPRSVAHRDEEDFDWLAPALLGLKGSAVPKGMTSRGKRVAPPPRLSRPRREKIYAKTGSVVEADDSYEIEEDYGKLKFDAPPIKPSVATHPDLLPPGSPLTVDLEEVPLSRDAPPKAFDLTDDPEERSKIDKEERTATLPGSASKKGTPDFVRRMKAALTRHSTETKRTTTEERRVFSHNIDPEREAKEREREQKRWSAPAHHRYDLQKDLSATLGVLGLGGRTRTGPLQPPNKARERRGGFGRGRGGMGGMGAPRGFTGGGIFGGGGLPGSGSGGEPKVLTDILTALKDLVKEVKDMKTKVGSKAPTASTRTTVPPIKPPTGGKTP